MFHIYLLNEDECIRFFIRENFPEIRDIRDLLVRRSNLQNPFTVKAA